VRSSEEKTVSYDPETYWSRVGRAIESRTEESFVAGDDNAYYKYKRQKFVRRFLNTIDVQATNVLEVGFGPGGNLKHIATHSDPTMLFGVDISQKMHDLATRNLRNFTNIRLVKIDGVHLPFDNKSLDKTFTVTVLQHITDEAMLKGLISEMCRVTTNEIIIMEDIGDSAELTASGACINRKVEVYKQICADQGFRLHQVQFLNTKISRRWHNFAWRAYRRLASRRHHEGDRIGADGRLLIGLPIAITRFLDDVFVEDQNLAKMVFHRDASKSSSSANRNNA
jgi:SAM-dependent methyltransferase